MCDDTRPVGLRCCINSIPLFLFGLAAQQLFDGCLALLVVLVDGILELGGEESTLILGESAIIFFACSLQYLYLR